MSISLKKIAFQSIKLIALFFISLLLLIWLLSPYISQHFAAKYLSEQKLLLSDSTTIRYNPFDSNITISNLEVSTVKAPDQPVMAIKSLSVTVSLYRLISDTLHFSKFTIDGLYLDINLNNEVPIIGGLVIGGDTNESTPADGIENKAEEPVKNTTSNKEQNYQVSLPHLTLTNATFNIAIKNSQQKFAIDALNIENVLASAKDQQAEVSLKALINDAPLSLNLDVDLANNQGEIASELALSSLVLENFQPFLTELTSKEEQLSLQGFININSKQSLTIAESNTQLNVEAFELSTENFSAALNKQNIAFNIAPLTVSDLAISLVDEQAPSVTGLAKLSIKDLIAFQGEPANVLAQVSAINLDEIAITTPESIVTAKISELVIEQSLFAENTLDELPPLAKFESLNISDISISEQGLLIDTIKLLGLTIDTNLDKDKNLVGLPLPEQTPNAIEPVEKDESQQEKIAQVETNNDKTPFLLSLNSFSLSDSSHINFTDSSTTPKYQRSFEITQLDAGPFDNQNPQQESHIKLMGTSNQYAHFDLAAIAKPFSNKDFYKLNGFFKEVSLPSLSTYIASAIKHELKSGQLDVNLDVTVDDKDISGNTLLLLRGVELSAANDHEADTVKSQTSIPFNMALGMLKDSDGNVELDIPLTGSTDDPSFGLRGFISLMIKQATMSAAKDYLMTTFVPYANVVNVALVAGDYLLKVRFNDLEFPVKTSQLQTEHNEFLAQFSALMKDKPETQLTLCAIATPADIDKPLGVEITNTDEIAQLAELSEQRLNAFKEYMVNEQGIESSRLLLCSAKIDFSIEAKPRITFTD